jgi:selenocysteine lyase/cysteine desulfurase
MSMIYFNNAATSYPKAPGVAEAVAGALSRLPGAANRGGIEDFDVLAAVRDELAALLGVSRAEQIGLGANATWGLNSAIHGLGLGAGDRVLTTAAEHNSVLRPLFALSRGSGQTIEYLPTDRLGRVRLDDWQAALERVKPRLCVVTHASNVTGALNDIAGLAELAHRYGSLLLVDIAQSIGNFDIRLEEWGVDLAAFTGHKYLLGPQGTGGLYVRPGLELSPLLTGGTGIHSDLDTMPPTMPLHIEAGTNNEPGFYGLLAALRWSRENGLGDLGDSGGLGGLSSLGGSGGLGDLGGLGGSTSLETTALLKDSLRSIGAHVIDALEPCTPVVSFTVDGFSPAYLGDTLLDNYDIIVRTGLHCAPRIFACLGVDPKQGTVRASLSRFTTVAEVDELVQALREIIAAGQA